MHGENADMQLYNIHVSVAPCMRRWCDVVDRAAGGDDTIPEQVLLLLPPPP